MTQRNEALAAAFEQAAGRILTAAEGLSDTAWDAAPAGELRTAGQIAYHMAQVYHNISGFIQLALAGQALPPLTMERIHTLNAEQVAEHASVGRAGTLALLRHYATDTAALLRTLSDAQLDTGTVFLGYPMTVESLAQNGLVGHTEEHLASIQRAASA
jgi:uncharacterized damage-inducible protein DinB